MRALTLSTALFALALSSSARAWDGMDLWYAPSAAMPPGGGGIVGTGGARDHSITCASCHTEAKGLIDLALDFAPALPTVGGQPTYEPGQTYQVGVKLVGEHLGLGGCDQYMAHVNNFAATVEDGAGQTAGELMSDSGQSSASCPTSPPQNPSGTTVTYGDCHAVIARGAENKTSWGFTWKAPSSGSGTLTLYYGAVDGDCDMSSLGDDVKMGTLKLGEASAALGPARDRRWGGLRGAAALLGAMPIGWVLLGRRRRARRPTPG